ncbi:MAG: hypothetical protein L0Z62_36935 [Gemmataceae bacterium]|nr:hypothetical protein [Gemmataceae bacterium]
MKRWGTVLLLLIPAACVLLHLLGPDYPPFISLDGWTAPPELPDHVRQYEDEAAVIQPRRVDLLQAEDFAFAIGVGSGMYGLEVFRVDGSGQASYLFRGEHGWWWRAEFQVPPEAVGRLRRLLAEIDYFSLKRAYFADVVDGTQWCIRVDAAGVTGTVYCDNHFPVAAMRLARFVGEEILPEYEAELSKARRLRESDARHASSDLWPRAH